MEFKINSGEFKHKILIERFTKIKDEDNRLVEVWNKLCDSRCKILYTRGTEYQEAYGTNSNVSATFYIRYNHKDINSKDRITYNGKTYNIIYVNNIQEANMYYEIKAELVQ